jgi:hypothetical protein
MEQGFKGTLGLSTDPHTAKMGSGTVTVTLTLHTRAKFDHTRRSFISVRYIKGKDCHHTRAPRGE